MSQNLAKSLHAVARTCMACVVSASLVLQMPVVSYVDNGTVSASQDATGVSDSADIPAVNSDESAQALVDALHKSLVAGNTFAGEHEVSRTDDALTAPGVYRLSKDIDAKKALQISAPAGQVIVLDLNGHDLNVEGTAKAALDLSDSLGTVAVVDSSSWKSDKNVKAHTISLISKKSDKDTHSIAAINAKVSDKKAKELKGDDKISLVLAGVTLSVDSSKNTSDVDANALSVQNSTEYFSSDVTFRTKTSSVSSQASENTSSKAFALHSAKPNSFVFMKGFEAKDTLTIACDDVKAGDTFARADGQLKADDAAKIALDTQNKKLTCAFDGISSYAFADAGQSKDASSSSATSGGKSSDTSEKPASNATSDSANNSDNSDSADNTSDASSKSASRIRNTTRLMAKAPSAEQGTDLNTAWNESGLANPLKITQSGTYYLSDDLKASSYIEINVPSGEVTLEFRGHSFTSTSSNGVAIKATSASKVTLEGDDTKASSVKLTGRSIKNVITSSAEALVVHNLNIRSKTGDQYLDLSDLSAVGISVSKGTLDMSGSTVDVDLSNQGNTTVSSNNATKNGPSGVALAKTAGKASITGSDINVTNSNVVTTRDGFDDVTSVGFARGIYSLTSSELTLQGSHVGVTSALGSAAGIYATNGSLGGEGSTFCFLHQGLLVRYMRLVKKR